MNLSPTDEKPPPPFLPLAGAAASSGVQILTVSGFFDLSSSSSNSLVSESLFVSRNSPQFYTTSPAKCFTTKWSSLDRVSSEPFFDDSLGAAKILLLACVSCSCAQNVLPDALGVLHAESRVA